MDCLVLGNGKSLKDFDFTKIKVPWVGCCLAFRHWNKINIHPQVYVNVDPVVCTKNREVIEYVKEKKCKRYLLTNAIKQVWKDYPKNKTIFFIEDLMNHPSSIFKYVRNWCSGTASVLFALEHFKDVRIAGFDVDYTEFIPECEKLDDGTLMITKTPKINPNYFFDDYQREGDIYNVPNGKIIHMTSWKELSHIMEFIKNVYPDMNRCLTNYNDKKSISEYILTKPLSELFDIKKIVPDDNADKVAFLVPSTSNKRNWNSITETYLDAVLFPSISDLTKYNNITVYIGYDHDDKLYSKIPLPIRYKDLNLVWVSVKDCKAKPTHIWNRLAEIAIKDGFEYLQIGGDDIRYDARSDWLSKFIKLLRKNNNIGYSAGFSNNYDIPTQFLFHKKHYELFGWIFPPQIHNWYCDNFIYGLYKNKESWVKEYNHYNVGGEPRYQPNNDKDLCNELVKRYKKKLYKNI